MMEKSWQEQRNYVCAAEEALSKAIGQDCRAEKVSFPDITGFEKISADHTLQIGKYTVKLDETGSVCFLARDSRVWADEIHPWAKFRYQSFSAEDYERYIAAYIPIRYDWAIEDMSKPGIEKTECPSKTFLPQMTGLYRKENRLIAMMRFTGFEHEMLGAPQEAALVMDFFDHEIQVSLSWRKKPANRLPEAMWLGFEPMDTDLRVSKLGCWMDPSDVVEKGGRYLHDTDWGVRYRGMAIEVLDSALVNVGKPALLQFDREPVPVNDGVYFNLHNNLWGTNFVMWYDEDALFRFHIHFAD